MSNETIIKAVKEEMDFGERPICDNCEHCRRTEPDIDGPYVYTCTFAGELKFEVAHSNSCLKWESQS